MRMGTRRTLLSANVAPWSIGTASADIDFVNRRMASSGKRRSFDAFMSYQYGTQTGFSRASAAYDQRLADPLVIDPYANDAARLRGDGLLIGPAATRLSLNPQNPQAANWTSNGSILSNLSADGAWLPRRAASAGVVYHGVNITTTLTVTNGVPISILFLYKAGTSGRARVGVYSPTAGSTSSLNGAVGALGVIGSAFGSWSNITNLDLGGGIYGIAATLTPNSTQSDVQVYFAADTTTAGQYVDVYGGQVTNTPYPREWILGTAGSTQAVAQDVLRWTAAQVGLQASEGWVGIRLTALGFDPAAATRVISIEQGSTTLSRIMVDIDQSGRLVTQINDDSNTAVAQAIAASSSIGVDTTVLVSWGGGSASLKVGAGARVDDAAAASPSAVSTLSIGSRYDNAIPSFIRAKRLDVGARKFASTAEFDATFARLAA